MAQALADTGPKLAPSSMNETSATELFDQVIVIGLVAIIVLGARLH